MSRIETSHQILESYNRHSIVVFDGGSMGHLDAEGHYCPNHVSDSVSEIGSADPWHPQTEIGLYSPFQQNRDSFRQKARKKLGLLYPDRVFSSTEIDQYAFVLSRCENRLGALTARVDRIRISDKSLCSISLLEHSIDTWFRNFAHFTSKTIIQTPYVDKIKNTLFRPDGIVVDEKGDVETGISSKKAMRAQIREAVKCANLLRRELCEAIGFTQGFPIRTPDGLVPMLVRVNDESELLSWQQKGYDSITISDRKLHFDLLTRAHTQAANAIPTVVFFKGRCHTSEEVPLYRYTAEVLEADLVDPSHITLLPLESNILQQSITQGSTMRQIFFDSLQDCDTQIVYGDEASQDAVRAACREVWLELFPNEMAL